MTVSSWNADKKNTAVIYSEHNFFFYKIT